MPALPPHQHCRVGPQIAVPGGPTHTLTLEGHPLHLAQLVLTAPQLPCPSMLYHVAATSNPSTDLRPAPLSTFPLGRPIPC